MAFFRVVQSWFTKATNRSVEIRNSDVSENQELEEDLSSKSLSKHTEIGRGTQRNRLLNRPSTLSITDLLAHHQSVSHLFPKSELFTFGSSRHSRSMSSLPTSASFGSHRGKGSEAIGWMQQPHSASSSPINKRWIAESGRRCQSLVLLQQRVPDKEGIAETKRKPENLRFDLSPNTSKKVSNWLGTVNPPSPGQRSPVSPLQEILLIGASDSQDDTSGTAVSETCNLSRIHLDWKEKSGNTNSSATSSPKCSSQVRGACSPKIMSASELTFVDRKVMELDNYQSLWIQCIFRFLLSSNQLEVSLCRSGVLQQEINKVKELDLYAKVKVMPGLCRSRRVSVFKYMGESESHCDPVHLPLSYSDVRDGNLRIKLFNSSRFSWQDKMIHSWDIPLHCDDVTKERIEWKLVESDGKKPVNETRHDEY